MYIHMYMYIPLAKRLLADWSSYLGQSQIPDQPPVSCHLSLHRDVACVTYIKGVTDVVAGTQVYVHEYTLKSVSHVFAGTNVVLCVKLQFLHFVTANSLACLYYTYCETYCILYLM